MRWSVSGVGALVGVIAFTGCGSALQKEYRREANAICAAAKKRLDEIPRASSRAQIPRVAERELAVREEVIARLGELAPPVDIAGAADNVFQDLEARQERTRALKKAAEDKDEKKLREIEKEARTESPFEAERARAGRLPACAEL